MLVAGVLRRSEIVLNPVLVGLRARRKTIMGFSAELVKNVNEMEWEQSPSPTVFRKRLELLGEPEAGRVTSVVRYAEHSRFLRHGHPDGEEIFVLEGVFSDEHGNFPAGTYLLNPQGFVHEPFSHRGCVLFVKLKQFPGLDREHVELDTNNPANWKQEANGVSLCPLYRPVMSYTESMDIIQIDANLEYELTDISLGLEIFSIQGDFTLNHSKFKTGSWVKISNTGLLPKYVIGAGKNGCKLYVKRNHLSNKI